VQAYTEVVVILPIERLFVFELESFQGVTDYRLDVDPLQEVFRALFFGTIQAFETLFFSQGSARCLPTQLQTLSVRNESGSGFASKVSHEFVPISFFLVAFPIADAFDQITKQDPP